jgi:hypothetical protein
VTSANVRTITWQGRRAESRAAGPIASNRDPENFTLPFGLALGVDKQSPLKLVAASIRSVRSRRMLLRSHDSSSEKETKEQDRK